MHYAHWQCFYCKIRHVDGTLYCLPLVHLIILTDTWPLSSPVGNRMVRNNLHVYTNTITLLHCANMCYYMYMYMHCHNSQALQVHRVYILCMHYNFTNKCTCTCILNMFQWHIYLSKNNYYLHVHVHVSVFTLNCP